MLEARQQRTLCMARFVHGANIAPYADTRHGVIHYVAGKIFRLQRTHSSNTETEGAHRVCDVFRRRFETGSLAFGIGVLASMCSVSPLCGSCLG
jgi:hypothetical protein